MELTELFAAWLVLVSMIISFSPDLSIFHVAISSSSMGVTPRLRKEDLRFLAEQQSARAKMQMARMGMVVARTTVRIFDARLSVIVYVPSLDVARDCCWRLASKTF
jgi:hypothetical protein